MSKKNALQIGLNELLSDIKCTNATLDNNEKDFQQISIDLIKPGQYQPRINFDKEQLEELANSVKVHGIIQPIVVRPILNGKYEIIAGERRWHAARLANLLEIPVTIKNIDDKQAIALSLIENLQRVNLNSIDTALSIQKLIAEFGMTHETTAKIIGKSRTTVTNLLRLLILPIEIKNMIQKGLIEMGHARAMLALNSNQQITAANITVKKKLSVRESEALVKKMQQLKKRTSPIIDPNIKELQKELSTKLTTAVSITHSDKGHGKIIIRYQSLDQLDNILQHLK